MAEGQGIGRWLAPWRLVVWAAALLAITGALPVESVGPPALVASGDPGSNAFIGPPLT